MSDRERYLDQLEDISAFSPDRRFLKLSDVSRYLGLDRRTVHQRFGIEAGSGITAVELARRLSCPDGQ